MIRAPHRYAALLALTVFPLLFSGAEVCFAQEEEPDAAEDPTALPDEQADMLKDLDMKVWGPWKQTAERDYVFEGKVTIGWRDSRIQADRMSLTDRRYVEAEGNVLIVWQGNRISGASMTYDLETERGVIQKAMGQVEGDFIFWAKQAEKVGEKTVHLKSATVTTCTQPVPYWSFSVTSATVTIDKYARMWNVLLRATRVPIFYSPYLIYPVKSGRALGLILPELHTNESLGDSLAQQLFIPLGRSADLTLLGEYYTKAGFGFGGEFRFIPNQRGAGNLNGFFINDKVSVKNVQTGELWGNRYTGSYQQTQDFSNGWRMSADINLVSDFQFYSEYERQIDLISTPQILQRLEFSRNGSWISMNARELRREQLLGTTLSADGEVVELTLLQQTLPEVEWRARDRKLGKSPLYLQFGASLASIQQRGTQGRQPIDADYVRADLFPAFSLPWSPTPWIDITPRADYRMTYYTQQQANVLSSTGTTNRVILDEGLDRQLWSAGLLIIGPKFSRIFGKPSKSQIKHAIEPRVTYGYARSFEDPQDIILYDEIDLFNGAGNAVTYSLVQRLFSKRPRSTEPSASAARGTIVMPDGTVSEPGEEPIAPPEPGVGTEPAAAPAPSESLEIASLEISQARSFDEVLRRGVLIPDGEEETSQFSNVNIVGRYNPDPETSFDLRSSYDILFKEFTGLTLSGGVRRRLAQIRFSMVYRNGLGLGSQDDTQVRLTTGFNLFRGRLRLLLDGTINPNPQPNEPLMPNRSWRVQYSTQCCTFHFEQLTRDFTINDRQDFYFRVDFKGIGKILQVSY